MTSLFKKHKRTPKELALKLANALDHLKDSGAEKDQESCGKYLGDMRAVMYGDGEIRGSRANRGSPRPCSPPRGSSRRSSSPPEALLRIQEGRRRRVQRPRRAPARARRGLPFVAYLEQTRAMGRCLTGSGWGSDRGERLLPDLRDDAAGDGEVRTIVPAHSLLPGFAKMFEYMQSASFKDRDAACSTDSHRHKALVSEYLEELRASSAYNQMLEKETTSRGGSRSSSCRNCCRSRQLVLDAQIHR